MQSRNDVCTVCSRILETIAQPFEIGDHSISLTASIGIAIYPEHSTAATELIYLADAAMYEAKTMGKNAFAFYRAPTSGEEKQKS
jgi:diguanylate cyclase (GGDEF)-like protein